MSDSSKRKQNEPQGFNAHLAVLLTTGLGSMSAFYVLIAWMLGWMGLAVLGIGVFRYDPYPFTFLLFLSNLVQLFAIPILAVGQQILNQKSEQQAEQTFKDAESTLRIQGEIQRLMQLNHTLTMEIHTLTLEREQRESAARQAVRES